MKEKKKSTVALSSTPFSPVNSEGSGSHFKSSTKKKEVIKQIITSL